MNLGLSLSLGALRARAGTVAVDPTGLNAVTLDDTVEPAEFVIDADASIDGTAYYLLDQTASRDATTIEAGGGLADGSFVVSGGSGVGDLDLTPLTSGDYYLHVVIKRGDGTYTNVDSQAVTITPLPRIAGAQESYTYDDGVDIWRILRVTADTTLTAQDSPQVQGWLVGPGGPGAPSYLGGGGGAAGDVIPIPAGTLADGDYPIAIGAAVSWGGIGVRGDSSTFNGLTALPGAEGGPQNANGADGPSGSGGGGSDAAGSDPLGGTATSVNGHDGGNGHYTTVASTKAAGGGGGGSETAGANGSESVGGDGGNGMLITRPDGTMRLAAGGGGSTRTGTQGLGGLGGGGDAAASEQAGHGADNTGSGGGSSAVDFSGDPGTPGDGAAGVLWLWFKETA